MVAQKKSCLFTLPGDAREVQTFAAYHGLTTAWVTYLHGGKRLTTSHELALAALIGGRHFLTQAVDGKIGTNDEHAYFAIFRQIVPCAYHAMLRLLEQSPAVCVHLKSYTYNAPAYRMEMFHAAAHNLPRIIAAARDGTPPCVVLTWPTASESEVS